TRSIFCFMFFFLYTDCSTIYVDQGNPYKTGQARIGEITFQETVDGCPLHSKAWFPLDPGSYPVIYFIGGLGGYVQVELYSTVAYDIATHGFFVLGVDYKFPLESGHFTASKGLGEDLNKYVEQYKWFEKYFTNRTLSTPLFNLTGLLSHSAGCDLTLHLIKDKLLSVTSNVFLEPYSQDVKQKINLHVPSLMYGTQYSEEFKRCAVPGYDYKAIYNIWDCPKFLMNVANFGHCDILDLEGWKACHFVHYCKTTNETNLPEYRQFVQGVVSAFFVSTLQGKQADFNYITDRSLIPLKLLELSSDMNSYFPLDAGSYPVIFFVGGLNGYFWAEYYSRFLYDVSTHGFFVFGVDYIFPGYHESRSDPVGQDLDIFFKQLKWLEDYLKNRTVSTPLFNTTALLCHSSGCDVTLRMIGMKQFNFSSNIFLEPFSIVAQQKIDIRLPSLMYGTQFAEEGVFHCNIKGYDADAIYTAWNCPKMIVNVANVGHCDILDPNMWEGCRFMCKAGKTQAPGYNNFIQGVVAAYFISTLQGRTIDMKYITDSSMHNFTYLELKSDLNC
ncbi:hypothetical protein FSP39_013067, partial [Pinctada imbricata]